MPSSRLQALKSGVVLKINISKMRFALVITLAMAVSAVHAQVPTGSLEGRVTDPKDAILVGVLRHRDLGFRCASSASSDRTSPDSNTTHP
jgi:hypothetical protein